jgi:hypothetical protein
LFRQEAVMQAVSPEPPVLQVFVAGPEAVLARVWALKALPAFVRPRRARGG